MGLSQPRQIFGIHQISPYKRTDHTFYGTAKVLMSSSLALSGSVVESFGGSQQFSWGAEAGQIKGELNLKCEEYPDFLWTLLFGVAPTTVTTPDNAGTLGALTNILNVSVMDATTGIASVAITASTGAVKVPFGKLIVVAVSATTVDVYFSTDIDFQVKNQGLVYQTDLLKITASALTITTSAGVTVIPNTGLQFVGGSGTIGMTTGDTAEFTSQPPSTRQMTVTLGASGIVYPEFGAIIMSQRRGTGELTEIDVYRMKGVGFPMGFDAAKWSEATAKATVLYDSVLNAVASIRYVQEQ